jgi:hypothetical protein
MRYGNIFNLYLEGESKKILTNLTKLDKQVRRKVFGMGPKKPTTYIDQLSINLDVNLTLAYILFNNVYKIKNLGFVEGRLEW